MSPASTNYGNQGKYTPIVVGYKFAGNICIPEYLEQGTGTNSLLKAKEEAKRLKGLYEENNPQEKAQFGKRLYPCVLTSDPEAARQSNGFDCIRPATKDLPGLWRFFAVPLVLV